MGLNWDEKRLQKQRTYLSLESVFHVIRMTVFLNNDIRNNKIISLTL